MLILTNGRQNAGPCGRLVECTCLPRAHSLSGAAFHLYLHSFVLSFSYQTILILATEIEVSLTSCGQNAGPG